MQVTAPRTSQGSLKDEIVRVAVELGTELGEDGLTMRGIASRLGVSATALYQHFEGKASILRAIRFHGLGMLNKELVDCFDSGEPLACIEQLSKKYIHFARKNSWLYGVLFSGEAFDYSALTDEEQQYVFESHVKVIDALKKAKETGQLRDGVDVETAPLLIWASNHGLAMLMLHGRIGSQPGAMHVDDESAFIDRFVENSVRGLMRA